MSLDAGTAEVYKYSHGGTVEEFDRAVANIRALAVAKANQKSDCTVGVGYLIDNQTISGMVKASELCADLGVDYIQFRPYYVGNWFGGPDGIDFERYRCAYQQARMLDTEDFKVLHSGPKFDKIEANDIGRNYSVCHGQQFCAVVTATGDVALCCLFRGQEKFVLGSIHKLSFGEIWAGERRRYVLAKLDLDKDCPPLCRCDGLNELLSTLCRTPTHINFL